MRLTHLYQRWKTKNRNQNRSSIQERTYVIHGNGRCLAGSWLIGSQCQVHYMYGSMTFKWYRHDTINCGNLMMKVMTLTDFPNYWSFVRGIHQSPVILLVGPKPLSEPMLPYCQLDPRNIFQWILLKFRSYFSRKCTWKYNLLNGALFVSGAMCWVCAPTIQCSQCRYNAVQYSKILHR